VSPDLAARRVVVGSMLYYSLDVGDYMPDTEFDLITKRLAGEWWDQLDPIRKWQLGSRDDIGTTGFHVKVTTYAAQACLWWLKAQGKASFPDNWVCMTRSGWRTSKRYGRYLLANEFTWGPFK
jgi:hypothetical protein